MATREEKDTTRGGANAVREFLTGNKSGNAFDHPEVMEVLKYCLSCKGCTNECPSSVDMSSLKAEFTHQYYQSHRRPLSDLAFGYIGTLGRLATLVPALANLPLQQPLIARWVKGWLGVAPKRTLPAFAKITLRNWYRKNYRGLAADQRKKGELFLFCDEFTNYQDAEIGIKAVELLVRLGYEVHLTDHSDSGRAFLSKGLLTQAKKVANENIRHFSGKVSAARPLVGLEPSAILSFRMSICDWQRIKRLPLPCKVMFFCWKSFWWRKPKKGIFLLLIFPRNRGRFICTAIVIKKPWPEWTRPLLS